MKTLNLTDKKLYIRSHKKLIQTLKKEIAPALHKLFQKIEEDPSSGSPACDWYNPILKSSKDSTRKENHGACLTHKN